MAQAVMSSGCGLRLAAVEPVGLASSFISSRQAFAAPTPAVRRQQKSLQTVAVFKKDVVKKVLKSGGSKTESGIFGTSGGIGFTKQNELFVGRMAMLGFAASLLGEALTGNGILAQFDLETGLPLNETEPLLIFFILFTLLGAIGALGDRGKFVDDDVEPGPIVKPGTSVKGALGLNEKGPTFGFTKANELFVGRMAQLGFAISILGEVITGKGALAQLNIETGVPINEIEPLVIFNVIFFFIAAINPGTGKFINDDDE
eukprot:TRINITY_DN39233_c0_g1_i1.p1 TRINITY_DN39233_c0_g1~~TRINITY_DN39233_c0_g1_i1.p1  ORF type:complete len:289 (+),score=56.79 TRINITY_DN39233_c0_g1_i1:92-868(+)